ncbi:MAG: serine/threonine-protein kinase [Planctomycetota bacterium]
MDEDELKPTSNLASFYDIAQDYGQVNEEEISPSLYALSQVESRYRSHEFIAEGGMKQVYNVYDARCQRQVAMAKLHEDAPLELCDPLIHEAWLTALLDHPNIITIHDVGVDSNNRPYFTMDLKTGDSLARLIEKIQENANDVRDGYSLNNLLQMFVKICDAIEYAHSVQVLHLDLKPANIQVGAYGEVLVCDWGLGRVHKMGEGIEFERLLLNSDLLSSNTLFGEVRGTPGYMSPEQIQEDGKPDTRTDIYQLGCILYSLLTLECPVEGEPQAALEATLRGEIRLPSLRSADREIPASLEAVVTKAMKVDPDARYQQVAALSEDVRRYLSGFATQAEDASLPTQIKLLYKRNRSFCLTLICSALVLIYGAFFAYWQLVEKERAQTTARVKAERTLALYEAGKDEQEKLTFQNAKSIERAVIEMHLSADSRMARQLLMMGLESEPDHPVLLRAIGEHYFIIQKFNQALAYLERGEKRNDTDRLVMKLAEEYAAIKPDDNARLTSDQMVELLRRIENFDGFEAMIVINDQNWRVDLRERAKIIKEHLHSINPKWKGEFEFDFDSSQLKISGKGLERLSSSGEILAGLQPKKLDISGTSVKDLWSLGKFGIEYLDIRDCPVNPYSIERFVHLKRLIIQPGQLSKSERKLFPEWVTIVVDDSLE